MKSVLYIFSLIVFSSAALESDKIMFKAPLLYPEGITYDAQKKLFFVSSVRWGTIGSVDMDGVYKELLKDPALKSSYGMKVDAKNNRLLVCISDANYSKYSTPATFKKMARLIGVDMVSGKKTMDLNLATDAGKHFANDLAMDEKGNIYVTDSYSPNVYKIDASGKATVFATSDWFKSEDVGLNGILYHPQGFLIVDHSTNGALYKIDIKNPKNITQVKIQGLFPGADGMVWQSAGMLAMVQNKGANKIYQISSNDNWATAEVKGATATLDNFQHSTTATVQDGRVWILNSKMNELADSSILPSREFSIQMAKFNPVQ